MGSDSIDFFNYLTSCFYSIIMARHPRFVLLGHPQHVIIRGNNREPIFITDEDYK